MMLYRNKSKSPFPDTGCSLEDQPEAMDDREGGEKRSGISCWLRDLMMMMFNCASTFLNYLKQMPSGATTPDVGAMTMKHMLVVLFYGVSTLPGHLMLN